MRDCRKRFFMGYSNVFLTSWRQAMENFFKRIKSRNVKGILLGRWRKEKGSISTILKNILLRLEL